MLVASATPTMTRVITVPSITEVGGERFRGTRYASEFDGLCCPSLREAHGQQALWMLCHVCWKPLRGTVEIWRNHVYHVGCGEASQERVRGSQR